MRFYLGINRAHWLGLTSVPLFVSYSLLRKRRSLPAALGTWCLDSRGFIELSTHGKWTISAREYAAAARRYMGEIGGLEWAAIQDWMCEPWILEKTGLSVEQHQQRTIDSWFELNDLAPDVPWVPILQGWRGVDYQRHVETWAQRGVDLSKSPVVGIGSVCRRQGTNEGVEIFRLVSWLGLRLHGFGVKVNGLRRAKRYLASADSTAWSYGAMRKKLRLPGHAHRCCSTCLEFALRWREEIVRSLAGRAGAGMLAGESAA